ncbi:hypothetical protein [Sagittula salina]|uniref:Uncharacterized protein n=1 Tax=Sagittula salina TaxID=2820268 RepID=A0A940MM48_9RHOB|nr:hypothetical protein [Sagittula salina]MBP0480983.1 hypothetical protein [Sagittula salina]
MAEEIEILGYDHRGLSVGMGPHVALVPEALLASEMMEVTQDGAEQWASAQRSELVAAITALVKGAVPPAPFDGVTLQAEG